MHNVRGNLWIVPDENKIIKPLFEVKISMGESHNNGIVQFINTYYSNENIVIDENDYNGAPCVIAELGHLTIKTEDHVSLIIFYIPEVITMNQFNWFMENRYSLINYQTCRGITLTRDEENNIVRTEIKGLINIENEIKNKNKFYREMKEGEKHAR